MAITKGTVKDFLIDVQIAIEESKSPHELLFYRAQEAALNELLGLADFETGYFEDIFASIHFPAPVVQSSAKIAKPTPKPEISWDKFKDYDHRWDDHPSWYTDNKAEQRLMVLHSRARARNF